MHSSHPSHPGGRRWRRAGLAAAVAGVAGLAAAAPVHALATRSAPPDPTDPAEPADAAALDDDAVAAAKAALERWLADQGASTPAVTGAADESTGAQITCPVIPDANFDYFLLHAGVEPGTELNEVRVDAAAALSPHLSAVAGESPAMGVACVAEGVSEPLDAAATLPPPPTDAGSATPRTAPPDATDGDTGTAIDDTDVAAPSPDPSAPVPPGSISLEGDTAPTLREATVIATAIDDSEFAAAITEIDPEAVVASPAGELDGELVGSCDATIDRCQAWWHQDGLAIGLDVTGFELDTDGALALVEDVVPTALVSLVAAAEGGEPSIPPPPTTEPEEPFERIEIPEGETATSVEGSVERGAFVPYAFNAGAGQQIDVTLSAPDGNATFDLFTPGGELIANDQTSFQVTAPEHGDYLLQVGATTGTADYTIDLAITGEADPLPPPDGGPIEIPGGETSTSVEGTVERGAFDTWTFSATAGQTVDLTVTSADDNATFDLFSPNGEGMANDETTFSGTLPDGGLYALEVGATTGTAEYTIELTIT